MSKADYAAKLKDPRWQRRRLQVFERDNFACLQCGERQSTLHAHHLYYVTGREPWDYPSWAINTLCDGCHEEAHASPNSLADWEVAVQKIIGGHGSQWELLDLASVLEKARPNGLSAGLILKAIMQTEAS